MLDGDLRLLSCSPGVDAGDNFAPGLGALDLELLQRVQDNDADGTATVSVGAFETCGGNFVASATMNNGTGKNPNTFTALSMPILGSSFDSFIIGPPETTLTVVAFDAASQPYALPPVVGEMLISITPATIYSYSSALHSAPIPNECALLGLAIAAQGFYLTPGPTSYSVTGLNRLDLVLGN